MSACENPDDCLAGFWKDYADWYKAELERASRLSPCRMSRRIRRAMWVAMQGLDSGSARVAREFWRRTNRDRGATRGSRRMVRRCMATATEDLARMTEPPSSDTNGPFIVTRRPACSCDCCPETRACCDSSRPSHRACATPEEAGIVAREFGVRPGVYVTMKPDWRKWDLLDGSTIEVERVTWERLSEDIDPAAVWPFDDLDEESREQIIDAWNAKHGSEE